METAAFEKFPPSMISYPAAVPNTSNPLWDKMSYIPFSGCNPAMELRNESSPYSSYNSAPGTPTNISRNSYHSHNGSNDSEFFNPASDLTPDSPAPSMPVSEHKKPVSRNSTSTSKLNTKTDSNRNSSSPKDSRARDTEIPTPKQKKRRMQNRVSQQAVRRRRNSPARILEARLQELDFEHSQLVSQYTASIESCIQTLSEEIRTLRELQGVLQQGTSVVPTKFHDILAGEIMKPIPSMRLDGNLNSNYIVDGLGLNIAVGSSEVHQSAVYQNHEYGSNFGGPHY